MLESRLQAVLVAALADLKLDRLIVVYPGDRRYALSDRVEVIPLADLVASSEDAARVFKRSPAVRAASRKKRKTPRDDSNGLALDRIRICLGRMKQTTNSTDP